MAMDLNLAQIAARKAVEQYGLRSKWSDIYPSEAAILDDLKAVHVPDSGDKMCIVRHGLYKSCDFIHDVAAQVQTGAALTEKQMTACKRCALQIKIAADIGRECY